MKIIPVILAGGTGSRLWPLSRAQHPKQFLKLTSSKTMLQETAIRAEAICSEKSITICGDEHRFLAAEQLREIDLLGKLILEPQGKNTAPAIALAALEIKKEHDDALMLVLSADHFIEDQAEFLDSVNKASAIVNSGKMATFGVKPTYPETGYGYIKPGKKVIGGWDVKQFVEKPDTENALRYLEEGYYWNSGMFLFKASQYLKELQHLRPGIYEICDHSIATATKDLDFLRIDKDLFSKCESESIDYAVMEHTKNAVVVPLSVKWSDIGSWSALWELTDKDAKGNVIHGDVLCLDSSNNLFRAEQKMIAAVGVDNVVVVETKDAVLVANKDKVQQVKLLVEVLEGGGRQEHILHREVYRPWGKYDSVDTGNRYQVKRITVKPGEKLSLQMHHHRSEHWIVVAGTAQVTIGGTTKLVTEDQSIYIPLGTAHALENPGKIPLEMIEVQTGSYLQEDDIVRFEDRYGRSK
ncbi:mannose-1-phosphate guanylyltransferase/mannose-6-phosphate isomerase [Vibrio coralliilyticus]|uniref:mannose-1-phosphate guanylyltransferase/mannose-6-phosphate isomerase n=1 Tax=Vibrio coralliilyticus TaxID=190893 RepID=UPI00148BFA3C|nr:mannose-1-phosphate guanylyltransferase/mannose-6-phosphate isomerase [Vibrio coralliilyticus]NOI30691.1 mannose-1-phosphate guanylyltransferase/mannose-6-phosphate isomerase [Vibrio coralliilyticus]NOI49761.1 mannose-1-phosphate guanylyltransferase/mannose-6-phosphate isomerase [Vibrio coralliilyticus]WFB48008.1 mannose-1-phosphate guanylyltransferase/mannose-6-phosphate isomerase [Vibrio coralliilyticus]